MTIDEMLALIPSTPWDKDAIVGWERRAQAISFATGNIMCMDRAAKAGLDEWSIRLTAAHTADAIYGTLIEMEAE